jgi:hypothetical protein
MGHRRRREDARQRRAQMAAFREYCETYWELIPDKELNSMFLGVNLMPTGRETFYRNLLVLRARRSHPLALPKADFERLWVTNQASFWYSMRVFQETRPQRIYKRMRAYYESRRKQQQYALQHKRSDQVG